MSKLKQIKQKFICYLRQRDKLDDSNGKWGGNGRDNRGCNVDGNRVGKWDWGYTMQIEYWAGCSYYRRHRQSEKIITPI